MATNSAAGSAKVVVTVDRSARPRPGVNPADAKSAKTKPWKTTILSLDGGGFRGVIPAVVLIELEKAIIDVLDKRWNDIRATGIRTLGPDEQELQHKPAGGFEVDLADFFDVISGTSTGSILAAYYATKGKTVDVTNPNLLQGSGLRAGSAAAALEIYRRTGPIIFKPRSSLWGVGEWWGFASQAFSTKYTAEGVESVLKQAFGNATLSSCKTSLLVTSFNLDTSSPLLFAHTHAKDRNNQRWSGFIEMSRTGRKVMQAEGIVDSFGQFSPRDIKLWEVVRSSTAAPTYFPPATVQLGRSATKSKLMDGGVVANNPEVSSLAFALHVASTIMYQPENPETASLIRLQDIAILSLGCGSAFRPTVINTAAKINGGLVTMFMDGSNDLMTETVHFLNREPLGQALGLKKHQLMRIQPQATESDQPNGPRDCEVLGRMDTVTDYNTLVEIANNWLNEAPHRYEAAPAPMAMAAMARLEAPPAPMVTYTFVERPPSEGVEAPTAPAAANAGGGGGGGGGGGVHLQPAPVELDVPSPLFAAPMEVPPPALAAAPEVPVPAVAAPPEVPAPQFAPSLEVFTPSFAPPVAHRPPKTRRDLLRYWVESFIFGLEPLP